MPDFTRLKALLRARHPAVRIVTEDEPEALQIALDTAGTLQLPVYIWTTLDGVREAVLSNAPPMPDTCPAEAALYAMARNVAAPFVLVTLDLAEHLEGSSASKVVRAWRELVQRCRVSGGHVIMIDYIDRVPPVVAAHSTLMRMSLPDDEDLESVVRNAAREIHRERPIETRVAKGLADAIVRNLRGLTRRQARQLVLEIVTDDFRIDDSDLPRLVKSKRLLVQAGGLLEYIEAPADLSEIGGLARLKTWLAAREASFGESAGEYGLTPPRGVLLLGVQGAGKSLAAKAIATGWKRPLLRLDPGALYDRYVGESERRLRDSLRQAEAMAPIVLWIDEIEKGFASAASQSTDGGLSQRMFGTLLTWMQEHRAPVFLVATANNIEALPPELLRKGRFDEIFFVDLPAADVREKIFAIHLAKRRQASELFDLKALAQASAGFSGAEIEQAVVAGLHAAMGARRGLTQADVLHALQTSPPLSVTMRERLEELREWARGRCVPAD